MLAVNRRNLGSTFAIFMVVLSIEGWRPFKFSLKNVVWKSFGNLTYSNASLSPDGALSVFVQILESLNHPIAYTEVYVDSGNGQYDFEILNRTVNLCEFFRNKRYEPLLQIFYRIVSESGSWPTACPIQKSSFSIENLIIDADKLPPYLPERKGLVTLQFKTKENGVIQDVSTWTIFFQVENIGINRLRNVKTTRKTKF